MKNSVLLFFFVLSINWCGGQNLVPNPSFEENNECPDQGYSEITMADTWINPTTYSPDYFNACAPYTSFNSHNVPDNWLGSQYARTGVAYAGLLSMIETDGREYIQTELIEPLIEGKKYLVTFYVSAADKSQYASNNIGAYFSNTSVSAAHNWVLPYSPQISNNHLLNQLSDTTNWIMISDTLIALGGEKYMTIGNFNDDAATHTSYIGGIWNHSHHFIDDVSVVCLDCSVGISETNMDWLTVFPNPASGYLNVNFNDIEIERFTILNSMGVLVLEPEPIRNNNFYQIDIAKYDSGLYFLKIETKNAYSTKQFIITK